MLYSYHQYTDKNTLSSNGYNSDLNTKQQVSQSSECEFIYVCECILTYVYTYVCTESSVFVVKFLTNFFIGFMITLKSCAQGILPDLCFLEHCWQQYMELKSNPG